MALLSEIYSQTRLDTKDISQAVLNIETKIRSNPLPWNGQFSPQLVEALLERYAAQGTILFDSFVGSGTILLEAGRKGIKAFGAEINPAAVLLARIYTFINVAHTLRSEYLAKTRLLLNTAFAEDLPIFKIGKAQDFDAETIKAVLVNMAMTAREPLQQRLIQALIVLLDYFKPELLTRRIFEMWKRLSQLIEQLPISSQPVEVFHADARQIPLPDHAVNLVITSPPYINVHNYHQQYRAAAEALGWDLLATAKSEIGSNRKHRGNRYFTVVQYALDIAQSFKELLRLIQSKGRIIFIVGRESTILGTRFFNGEIVAEVAHQALGFDLALKQERVFTNRFGERIFEDILHFVPPAYAPKPDFLEPAREVAGKVLRNAFGAAPDNSRSAIRKALEVLPNVLPSPLFEAEVAYKGLEWRESNATLADTTW